MIRRQTIRREAHKEARGGGGVSGSERQKKNAKVQW